MRSSRPGGFGCPGIAYLFPALGVEAGQAFWQPNRLNISQYRYRVICVIILLLIRKVMVVRVESSARWLHFKFGIDIPSSRSISRILALLVSTLLLLFMAAGGWLVVKERAFKDGIQHTLEIKVQPKPINLSQLVNDMEELFSRTVGPSIEIETRLDSEPWATLCDPNQLENALLNLVINARDAMPEGGQLVIETTNAVVPDRRGAPKDRVSVDVPPGDYVVLSVTDTGTGMSPEVLARAFDPFFTTKPLGQGTGLGLSMIHGFVQQSGGQVHLNSEEGKGTRVTIYLSRHLGAMNGEADAAAGPPGAANAVVLVVGDEPPVRMVVVDTLSDLGYTVLEAGDGRAGLRILESTARIDLLLTDVGLPGGMNGRQLADASRQRRPDLKVLFMTGYADTVVVGDRSLEQGMQVMTKPFALNALAARVQGIMSG